ncbi:MAG: hypothetical protein WBZ29_05350 [Methanocella sp.]
MKDMKLIFILIAAVITAAVFLAGCTTPTPTPSVSPSPTVPPAISAAPTQAPGSDRADIDFTYSQREYSQPYEGIPVGQGELLYAFDVTVNSDKPVYTDESWFTVEYQQNSSAELKIYPIMTNIGYPWTTIGNDSAPAKGRLLVVLPAPGGGAIGPTPVYFKPMDKQVGSNKVYSKVYGVIRST